MRLRHITGCEEKINNSPLVVKDASFAEGNELKMEFGMGKGDFIIQNALKFPNNFFIGVEKFATVVLKALEKINGMDIPNLRFMCEDVATLEEIIKPHSVKTIYLNFSDPWPKKKHAKRRLTSESFLKIYEKLLEESGEIEFKTDNVDLFNYSLESFKDNGWQVLEFTYDLHNNAKMNEGNIMTEYERKFSQNGNKICKLIAKK